MAIDRRGKPFNFSEMQKIAEAKKPSFAALKEKAGKAFLNADAVKGGVLADCHLPPLPPIEPIRTDNI
ncbi:MAG: hypothetical protein R2791_16790 [Saprospiraceae bacterium]